MNRKPNKPTDFNQIKSNNKARSNRNNQPIPHKISNISLKAICELYEKKPEEIVARLANPTFGFQNYLNAETMGNDLVFKLLALIEKCFECNSLPTQLRDLIKQFAKSNFFLKHVYEQMSKKISYLNIINENLIKTVLNVCCLMLELDPLLGNDFEIVNTKLELMIKNRLKNDELNDTFDTRFQKLIQISEKVINQHRNHKTFTNIDFSTFQPPNDFTEMSIIPSFTDIIYDQIAFLRKNLTNKSYESVNHYLDVQFRLLREDFLQPLRLGVGSFREIIKTSDKRIILNDKAKFEFPNDVKTKLKKIESLNIYFEVEMTDFVLNDKGLIFNMKINTEKTRQINWENSKKLMFGSLVCFSSDLFKNECLIGIVSERDEKLLKKGVICINFNLTGNDLNQNNTPTLGKNYIMLETSAYFESYRHVLEALVAFKNLSDEEFPFKQHIIDCQNSYIDRPNYLKNVEFDFRPIVDFKKKIEVNSQGQTNYIFSDESRYAQKIVLSNDLQWPKAQNMKLDDSQYNAVKLALENKLALIQGPPGTGKTFIGVKIVELLLHNKRLWWNKPNEPHRPILMICYTNHALDQFLEYCLDECQTKQGIIRVGGRSKSEKLEPFMLRTVKQNLRNNRMISNDVFYRIKDQLCLLNKIREDTEKLKNLAQSALIRGILTITSLKDVILENHFSQLTGLNKKLEDLNQRSNDDFTLLEWLGLFDIEDCVNHSVNDLAYATNNLNISDDNNENDEIQQENGNIDELEDMDDEEADEMAKEANFERMLDDDFDDLKQSHKRISKDKNKFFDYLIDQDDIYDMLIQYNFLNGSNYLSYLIRTNKLTLWETKTKGRRQRRKNKNDKNKNNEIEKFIDNRLKNILEMNSSIDEEKMLEQVDNIWYLNHEQRAKLYFIWLRKYNQQLNEKINDVYEKFNLESAKLTEFRLQEDLAVMKNALIIAMTTTGSSRYHKVLKDIAPRIVIVEEAAEVFEAHIVSSLSKKCEHLILIGDHVQLRPNPNVYKLAKDFHLDVSLFERLINNNIKRVMLTTQHRMRPEISSLMRNFYEKQIIDHPSVFNFESIIGLKTNIFFLNHEHLEKNQNEGQSKLNEFEASYIVKLCEYIQKQKQFEQSRITVLSMYLGQMMLIKRMLKSYKLTSIKVTTVDNYQGEENDIIILSLVRSNFKNNIGFLKINNRVCVALSRARKGLYCIGNMRLVSENSDTWHKIIKDAESKNCLGNSLALTCGLHPLNDIQAKEPTDFDLRPDGGCRLPCDFRLKCGHVCELKCHTYDLKHKNYVCKKKCEKIIERCKHNCKKICSHQKECSECAVSVMKLVEECGHLIEIRCDTNPLKSMCDTQCSNILKCGHQCVKECREICGECEAQVQVELNCHSGNNSIIKCKNNKVWLLQEQCNLKCNKRLECSHICQNQCSRCFGGRIHFGCSEKCDRTLFCGHPCDFSCAMQCQPCRRKCENKCPHSSCKLICSSPCIPCQEPCKWKCIHKKCTKRCFEICDRDPCNFPCKKKLKCGHECIGLCGEPCPPMCRMCDKDKVKEIFFGTEDEPDARFVYLKDCKHIVEYKGMDEWMHSRFNTDENNNSENSIQLPSCPKCKTPIRLHLRYLNYVRMQLNAIDQIKLKHFGDTKFNKDKQDHLILELNSQKNKIVTLSPQGEPNIYVSFFNACLYELENNEDFSFNELVSYENSLNVFIRLVEIYQKMRKNIQLLVKSNQLDQLNYELNKLIHLIYDTKSDRVVHNFGQKLQEILNEINRIENLLSYFQIKHQANVNKNSISLDKMYVIASKLSDLEILLVHNINSNDLNTENLIKKNFKDLEKLVSFELTSQERLMVVKAIGLSKGHWFKCPNGHVYCIGECGGAMEKSVCPECKSVIGGTNHALEANNTLASEMDGAQYAAWSETANNMRNWNI